MNTIYIHAKTIDPRGFEVRFQEYQDKNNLPLYNVVAYGLEGGLIGNVDFAIRLTQQYGMKPELALPFDEICSIGFSASSQKWYGYNSNVIMGFTVGDSIAEGDMITFTKTPWSLSPGFKAKTLQDARWMAIAFAKSISFR